MRITLDAETFKALASTTRLSVLRALDERRKTLSELARDLALNKATVHEHLQLLAAAELVKKRDDEGRKWIYYELTWRGQKILHPQETTTFNVLLGLSVLAAGGGAALLARALWLASESVGPAFGDREGDPRSLATGSGSPAAMPASDAAHGTSTGASTSTSTGTQAPASGTSTSTSTGTQASTATGASTSTAGEGQGASAAPGAGMEADKEDLAALDDGSWLDEGGAFALVLLAAGLLFALFATVLRLRLRPKAGETPGLP